MHLTLKALGTLGLWISDLGARTVEREFLVTIRDRIVPRERVGKSAVPEDGDRENRKISKAGAGVLEIDVLGAWRDLGLEAGWGNEVTVTILMRKEVGGQDSGYLDLSTIG